MAKTKISKVAKDLNVSVPTVIEFLRTKNIEIDDNPNTRIEDEVVNLLMGAFKSDKDLKNRSTAFSNERKESKVRTAPIAPAEPAPAPVEEVKAAPVAGPHILGKLELDANGNPVVRRPQEAPKAEAPKPAAPKAEPKVEEPKAEAPKAAPVEAPAPKPEAPKAEAPKPAAPVQNAPKPAAPKAEAPKAPAPKPAQPKAEAPKPAAPKEESSKAEAPASAEPEVFTIERSQPAPSLNIVGKIDLDAINLTTRPKKKTKEERRNERNAGRNNGAQGAASAEGDRKKRRRIAGKEKVDIEKAGRQAAGDNRQGGNNRQGGAQGGNNNRQGGGQGGNNQRQGGKNDRNRRQPVQQPEVHEEDVQKQVKETLARLTSKDKNLKRGAKWRKEKREAKDRKSVV